MCHQWCHFLVADIGIVERPRAAQAEALEAALARCVASRLPPGRSTMPSYCLPICQFKPASLRRCIPLLASLDDAAGVGEAGRPACHLPCITVNPAILQPATRLRRLAAALCASVALVACAAPKADVERTDSQAAGAPPLAMPVLVVCEAPDAELKSQCEDRLGALLQERGVAVVAAPQAALSAQGQVRGDARYLAPARAAGAKAVWVASVGLDMSAPDSQTSASVSIGLGGFGRRGGVGAGVGVAVPIGTGAAPPRYAADTRITDVASGRLVWSAKAGSPPAGDAGNQMGHLLQRLVGAAAGAHVF